MKKFKFYALAFAAIAFAGCSDDVIDGQGANTGVQGDAAPAYLTISFSANGNSSRATDNNTGDYDGNAEDSGHESTGVAEETAVKTALLVVSPVTSGSTGFAKTYTISSEEDAQNDFKLIDDATDYYTLTNPIQVTAGETYRVLVVLNPASSLTDQVTGGQIDNTNNAVENLYKNIIEGQYNYTGTTTNPDNYINAANSIGMGLAFSGENNPKTDAAFMMANKEEVEVTPDANNTETNPCVAEVEVERALSKITFRTTNNNIYPVELSTGTVPAETIRGAYDPKGGNSYQAATFNKATLNYDNTTEVYALYDASNEFVGVYQKGSATTNVDDESNLPIFTRLTPHTAEAYEDLEDKNGAYIASGAADDTDITLAEEAASFTLAIDEDAVTDNTTWYVRLEGYALVNLAKEVNYVRHTVSANGGLETPFGTLNGTNYLWTPYFEAKNALDVTTDFSTSIQDDWYYNTLADVSTESKTLVIGGTADKPTFTKTGESGSVAAEYYKPMSLITDDSEVSGVGDNQHKPDLPYENKTGDLMAYCFENSTDATHQTHGLSTCISFVARIYSDESCSTPIDNLYSYNGFLFTSLQQLVDAFDGKVSDEIKELATSEAGGTEITREAAEAVGVLKYQGNTCYYYTTEIKHFDNQNDNTLGNMEFAIMRNNIYSLAVTGIENIGTPFVDPTPNTPDESSQAYLNVKVTMIPWIVRYNDIEF